MPTKKRILILAIHRFNRAPNEKFRIAQYFKYASEYDVEFEYKYIINEWQDNALFQSNNFILKMVAIISSYFKRLFQIVFMKKYHAVIILRELHYIDSKLLLYCLRIKNIPIIYDFDDSIWLNTNNNPLIKILKNQYHKTIRHIQFANVIIAGNEYLANFAKKYNNNIIVIPTVVDTDYYQPNNKTIADKIILGWMGSHTTLEHFKQVIPVLNRLKEKYSNIEITAIADESYIPELNLKVKKWNNKMEINDLNSFDIGIMPLPNDEWSKGKCGLKALTYMSCGVPCVISDIGVNQEIITKTKGGYSVKNDEEWIEQLSLLIENTSLRKELGSAGREGVLKYYSVQAYKQKFFDTICNI